MGSGTQVALDIRRDIEAINRLEVVPSILEVVMHTTGMRFVAIARVTDSSWTACAVRDELDFGLEPGGELVLESTICNEIRQHHQPVVFGHASVDPHYANHHTPKMYQLESYISIPIFLVDGRFFGTLCAIDTKPAKLDQHNVKTLQLFAKLIANELVADERRSKTNQALLDAEETARLRDQFIAILGHDLRQPLHAVQMNGDMLRLHAPDERSRRLTDQILSSCARMSELIGNVLDFARGRLSGGIRISRAPINNLAQDLQSVVNEIKTGYPTRTIVVDWGLQTPVVCDSKRIAQLLGNLLGNAVTHGAVDQPISVAVHSDATALELAVTNRGEVIPADVRDRLFLPFTRGDNSSPRQGLGLGLYIATEIARAHGGTITVESNDQTGTRFAFRMPAA